MRVHKCKWDGWSQVKCKVRVHRDGRSKSGVNYLQLLYFYLALKLNLFSVILDFNTIANWEISGQSIVVLCDYCTSVWVKVKDVAKPYNYYKVTSKIDVQGTTSMYALIKGIFHCLARLVYISALEEWISVEMNQWVIHDFTFSFWVHRCVSRVIIDLFLV